MIEFLQIVGLSIVMFPIVAGMILLAIYVPLWILVFALQSKPVEITWDYILLYSGAFFEGLDTAFEFFVAGVCT